MDPDHHFMKAALDEAIKAMDQNEVPVGAVVVQNGMILGRGHNQVEQLKDPTAHAEMLALTAAGEVHGDWRLTDCDLYVTLEPCTMCIGASLLARIKRVIYGAPEPKHGACGSLVDLRQVKSNHQVEVISGVMAEDAAFLMQEFFRKRRTRS